MTKQFDVEPVTEHQYLVRAHTDSGIIESWFRADPETLEQLGLTNADELQVVEQTAVYLAGRQPVEDFPPMLDLLDVMASYEDYPEHIRRQLGA
ncbi:hypothetical protein [Arthrobacter sp. ok362]|jgi:hypothetical protein|uniref:hypothetical protein n=1 Tax=Arthrobacter sp. ok362 TaxID=1761745 RepID=UPI00088DCBC0|nr:hypothetical protein [Arthrobacter sp. ok362]SDM03614.1 hypothetical protein SAMN04487913_12142 [Arthrobacter sp. ok362]